MEGRVDWDKYPLSAKEISNALVVTQGPATKRNGTRFVAPVANESYASRLFEFEFSPTQGYVIELNDDRFRFITNRGLVLEDDAAVTAISTANPAVVTAASHGYSDGDQVVFTAVGPYSILANRVFTVDGSTTDTFKLSGFDGADLPAFSGSPTVARVYSVTSPFDVADIPTITTLHSADVLTLMHGDYQPRKLSRNGATDWSMESFVFKDGPYLSEDTSGTTLTPASRGRAVPIMTSNTAPSGTITAGNSTDSAWKLFDGEGLSTVVLSGSGSTATLEIDLGSGNAKASNAYWMTSDAANYRTGDMPDQWTLKGSTDGSTWETLDKRDGETGWASNETRFYKFTNEKAYRYYHFDFAGGGGTDTKGVDLSQISLNQAGDDQTPFSLTASDTDGINDGDGFKSTDVGRCIRLFGSDAQWRWARITDYVSSTEVKVRMYGQALPDLSPIKRWRLGLYSDTTGWPPCGAFYQNRQVFAGPAQFPNRVCFSETNVFDSFTPSEDDGTVTDSNGFTEELIEQTVTAINWMQPIYRGLVVGTAEGEAIVAPGSSTLSTATPLTPTNIRTSWPTRYGSAAIRPRFVDTATLFVDRRGVRVRELVYDLQSDTFVAPDMNATADHITAGGLKAVAWQQHPNRVLWSARADGKLLGFSYEREQSVTAWHKHTITGFDGDDAVVEECAIVAAPDGKTEDLWMVVKRGANRYIEYIGDWFWHDTELEDAVFLDCAVRYSSDTAVTTVGGLWHLEGQTVTVFADGVQLTATYTVTDGKITIPNAAKKILVGLRFKLKIATLRPTEGAQNGSSQGKIKRIYQFILRLYPSFGGTVGDQYGRSVQIPGWPMAQSFMQPPVLMTGDTPAIPYPGGWEQDGITVIENDTAYPFTVICYMPQLMEIDG